MLVWLWWSLVCFAKPPVADPALAASARLRDPIPTDPAVHHGTLDNGMQWFVEHNEEPKDRLVLRLVVRVGSIVEDDDQLGLAHLVEHMAFNGSAHFPGNEVVRVMESFGAKFGADVNAHTSFDETVYKLTVPTDNEAGLEQAFLILEDWAHALTLDPAAVDSERGVVLEEWRGRQGPGQRAFDVIAPLEYGAAYASRQPIGTETSLRTFKQAAIERYVRDWYRPDLMAVIAVGDVDPAWAEAKIREHMGPIPKVKHARKRLTPDVPPVRGRRVVVFTDPELTSTSASFGRTLDDVNRTDHAGAREAAIERLMLGVVNDRLLERKRAADQPFQSATVQQRRISPTEGARALSVGTLEGKALTGLEVALTEWVRARNHGIYASELDRARQRLIAAGEKSLERRADRQSADEATELVRVFTNGEYYTDLAYEVAMNRHFYETISVDEVNALLRTWLDGDSQLTKVILPARGVIPTEAEVAALVDRVLASAPPPLPEVVDEGPLVPNPPAGGQIAAEERPDPAIATVHWTLANGVQVWFKKTDFTPGSVSFTGFSPGGTWSASEADWFAATSANELTDESGAGPHDLDALRRRLAGSSASAGVTVRPTSEGFDGSARAADLDTMFELLWLKATAPRFDEAAFTRVKARYADSIRQRDANPDTAFRDAQTTAMWGDALWFRPWTLADLDRMGLARSEALYRAHLADLSDTTFIFVGDVDEATLKEKVARWLGSLPGGGAKEATPTIPARRLPGQASVVVRAGVEPRASVRIVWHGAFQNDVTHRSELSSVSSLLTVLLRESLREDRGGVYGVSAGTSSEHHPTDAYELSISFNCDPARKDELVAAALAVVDQLRAAPVSDARIADERSKRLRAAEVQVRENSFWTAGLRNALQHGEPLDELLRWRERIEAVTAAGVQQQAVRYLDDHNRKIIVRLPAE